MQEVEALLQFFQEHEDLGKQIAAHGFDFIHVGSIVVATGFAAACTALLSLYTRLTFFLPIRALL
jgi:translation initiation factor 2B subunit (eIF-2B alpha/beta/delta family)